ncbi:MAG: hypothetical protein ABIR24_09740 [Verrucomicrobiota bacterium]
MSLKAFHIIFIAASTLLAFGFGAWELRNYFATGENQSLWFGILSLLAGVALLWYGKVVLKKLKHISYL